MKENATITSALENRILSQENQSIDLNEWIFNQLKIKQGDEILELCCGTGAQTAYFNKFIDSGSLTCIDVNKNSIDKAKLLVENDRVEFIISEIDYTQNYIKKKFDVIFSAYGFYYSNNAELLHKELKSSLKKNGRFILVGPTIGNNKQLYDLIVKLGCKIPNEVLYSSESFMLRFMQIFLKDYTEVKIIKTINQIHYDDHESLLSYWKNTTFYNPGLDEEFLSLSKKYFSNDIIINKSIAYLEGIL